MVILFFFYSFFFNNIFKYELLRAFDHICMEKARYKCLIIIIKIIINHVRRSHITWLPVTSSVLDMIIGSYDVTGSDFENALYSFGQSER